VTQTLTGSGSVDLQFRRTGFRQMYSDIITGESTGATGTTAKVEMKYSGEIRGTYRATGSAQLDLTNIDNATEMQTTTTVNGIAAAPHLDSPAPGTAAQAVTLAYTCRGNALQITAGGAAAQHYTRVH
jgi:hypothetical protein